MIEKCSKYRKEILWLKAVESRKTPNPKFNPINALPILGGNLLVNLPTSQYRFATKEELAKAKLINKPLYTSHFVDFYLCNPWLV